MPIRQPCLGTGKADQAIHALNLAIARAPNDARSYNLLCRVYYQLELWDNAVHMAEKAVELEPQNSSYHLWLGRAMGRKAEVGQSRSPHSTWRARSKSNLSAQ